MFDIPCKWAPRLTSLGTQPGRLDGRVLRRAGPHEARVETLPAFVGAGNPTVAPRPQDAETLQGDLGETVTLRAAVEALREAVDTADAGCRKDAAAAAWHAGPLLRFLCISLGRTIAGMRVSEDGFIVVTAELSAVAVVGASIAVGPAGSFVFLGEKA